MRRAWVRLVPLALALGGCRDVKHVVEHVEVVGPTLADNPALGLEPGQVKRLWMERLGQDRHFRLLPEGARPPEGAVRMTLELAFTREEQRQDRPGTWAEVGVMLGLRRRSEGGTQRYDVTGLGEARLSGDSPPERQAGLRAALRQGEDQALEAARLQLDAVDKTDRALARDLTAQDTRVRDAALRVLADRRSPAAVPGLIAELQSPDADEVRRAMGELVEVGDVRAVPALIELMRGKDPGFSREILFALGALGGDEAQAYLYTVAQGHEQQPLREAAEQALEELNARAQPQGTRVSATGTPDPTRSGRP